MRNEGRTDKGSHGSPKGLKGKAKEPLKLLIENQLLGPLGWAVRQILKTPSWNFEASSPRPTIARRIGTRAARDLPGKRARPHHQGYSLSHRSEFGFRGAALSSAGRWGLGGSGRDYERSRRG